MDYPHHEYQKLSGSPCRRSRICQTDCSNHQNVEISTNCADEAVENAMIHPKKYPEIALVTVDATAPSHAQQRRGYRKVTSSRKIRENNREKCKASVILAYRLTAWKVPTSKAFLHALGCRCLVHAREHGTLLRGAGPRAKDAGVDPHRVLSIVVDIYLPSTVC